MNENMPDRPESSEEPKTLEEFYNQLDKIETAKKDNSGNQSSSASETNAEPNDMQFNIFAGMLRAANPSSVEGREDIEDTRDTAIAKASLLKTRNPDLSAAWSKLADEASQKLSEGMTNTSTETTEYSKSCPKCGAKNREQAIFCNQCGNSFAAIDKQNSAPEQTPSKVCSNCKHVNRPQARFCAMCGTVLAS